jgi:NAD(P)-dependent dehydrogenase (short-subunit alcohol dehydrogenase family)
VRRPADGLQLLIDAFRYELPVFVIPVDPSDDDRRTSRGRAASDSARGGLSLESALADNSAGQKTRAMGARSATVNGVIVITGGSRGIGAATARLAASRGYAVAVNYRRNRESAGSVVRAIEAAGGRAIAVQADVANEAEVAGLFEASVELGPLVGLVNNAAILETQMRVEAMDAARLQRVFATNVFGAFACAREAVRRMSTRHGGRGGAIVNVSSGAARLGAPNEYVDYAASKGAIDTLTIGLAREVAEEGIRVNAVRPGFIYTEMHASGGEPNRVDRVKAFVPMKRGGTAEEVANAIVWLLSEESSYSTGTFIDVTGGR